MVRVGVGVEYPWLEKMLIERLRSSAPVPVEVVTLPQWTVGAMLHLLRTQPPALVVMDASCRLEPEPLIEMSRGSGAALVYLEHENNPFRALRYLWAGFKGYAYLGDDLDPLLSAWATALRSGGLKKPLLSPSVYHGQQALYQLLAAYDLPSALLETLCLLGEGYSLSAIADLKGVRQGVVHNWVYRLRVAFGVETTAALNTLLAASLELPAVSR